MMELRSISIKMYWTCFNHALVTCPSARLATFAKADSRFGIQLAFDRPIDNARIDSDRWSMMNETQMETN